jgi:hypothetical protein
MARNKNESASPPGTVAQVKERPILFNGAMVRALLAGEKTQTRRIVKTQPRSMWAPVVLHYHPIQINRAGHEEPGPEVFGASDEEEARKCPYGQPGDRLWVRESHYLTDDGHSEYAVYAADPDAARSHLISLDQLPYGFPADVIAAHRKLRPSIHMPRWASRIPLEITEVRVERLQAITEADARAEGTEPFEVGGLSEAESALLCGPLKEAESPYRNGYALLWDSINGVGDWDRNPWVWVVCFRRIDTGEHTQIKAEMEHAE